MNSLGRMCEAWAECSSVSGPNFGFEHFLELMAKNTTIARLAVPVRHGQN